MPAIQFRSILAAWAVANSACKGLQQVEAVPRGPSRLERNQKNRFVRRQPSVLQVRSDGTPLPLQQLDHKVDLKVEEGAVEVTAQKVEHNEKRDLVTTLAKGSTGILSLVQGVAIAVATAVLFVIGVLVFIGGRGKTSCEMAHCDSEMSLYKWQKSRCSMYQKHTVAKHSKGTFPGSRSELPMKGAPSKLVQFVKQDFMATNVGILVSDMSGFTRLTREHGLVHFASIIIRMRQICLPILHHYGASLITTEADDFIVIFPTAKAAVQAADGMIRTVKKYNDTLPAEKSHFALTLNGVGVDFGQGPLMDKHDKLFGPTVSNAYSLGEDLCERSQVLVTGRVKQELTDFTDATYKRVHKHDNEDVATCADGVFELQMEAQEDFQVAKLNDSQYLHANLIRLVRRHELSLTERDLLDMDSEITSQFSLRRTVLMIAFDCNVTEDPELQMELQYHCLAFLRPILDKHKAQVLEEELYLFPDPCLAVAAALEMRDAVDADKEMFFHNGLPRALIKGYGIHEGNILLLEDTDVHWGDPVNTASKLGQDLAKDGEMLVSDHVFQSVVGNPKMSDVKFEMIELKKSRVEFQCHLVTRKNSATTQGRSA